MPAIVLFLDDTLTDRLPYTALAQLRPGAYQPDASLGCAELPWAVRDLKYVCASDGADPLFSLTE